MRKDIVRPDGELDIQVHRNGDLYPTHGLALLP